MSKKADIDQKTACEPLLEMAKPDIYRRNLFRALELPVNAAPKEVRRLRERRKMQQKLGIASDNGQGGLLVLKPPPSDEEIRLAMERMNSPKDRLLDEIFWFWPINGDAAEEPALKALEQGDAKGAAKIWRESYKNNPLATHNLAVLGHLVALDAENSQTSSERGATDIERLSKLWDRAFGLWKKALDNEEFWDEVKSRVRDMNDVQLTTGFVRRARSTLPMALLLINAKIAYGAAERSDIALARRHVGLIQKANFENGVAEQAILEALRPVRNRIKTATETAKSRWTTAPHRGHQYVRELHEHAKDLLAVLDAILPEEDPTRGGLHDAVAEAMLEGQIAFGNKTNDWAVCLELIKLARDLAVGERVKERLSENEEIIKRNNESANDWCSPGYWDLPEKTIEKLEDARAKSQAGDHEGAVRALVTMDPAIGNPLRRCLACALSQCGIQKANQGLQELNQPTKKLQKFIDVIGRKGTIPIPNQFMQSWQLPDCPCCGNNNYTSWINGEYNGQQFWMCSSCADSHNREIEQRKGKLRTTMSEALEYILLANETDPADKGIRENLDAMKKVAKDVDLRIPNTKRLKKQLGAQGARAIAAEFEPQPCDQVCYFCGENAPDHSCAINVPMFGNVQSVDYIFWTGVEYQYADISAPRCRRCRDEHRELPERIEKWRQTANYEGRDERFPELFEEVKDTESFESEAKERADKAGKKADDVKAALNRAKNAGKQCEKCGSDKHWRKNLCRQCDAGLFYKAFTAKFLVPLALTLYFCTGVFVALFVIWAVIAIKDIRKRKARKLLIQERKAEIPKLQESIPKLETQLKKILSVHKGATTAAKAAARRTASARKKLEAAKEQAIAEFEKTHPAPTLPEGIKSEDSYLKFQRIEELRRGNWGFGKGPEDHGKTVESLVSGQATTKGRLPQQPGAEFAHPINVKGLVAPAKTEDQPVRKGNAAAPELKKIQASRFSKKYHTSDCPEANRILSKNKISYPSAKEAEKAGYSPCEKCI